MDIGEVNSKVADLIKKELTEVSYNTWCKTIGDAYIEENNIIIPVTNDFEKGIIQNRYLELFNTAYKRFLGRFSYDGIIIIVNKNIGLKQGEEESYEYKTAKYMKELADKKNLELIDTKKEIEKTLKKILDTVEMMAEKGNYSTSYICDKTECNVIEDVIEELKRLGFEIRISDFADYNKAISIKWGSENVLSNS